MNYTQIIDEIVDNLGKSERSTVFISIVKRDILKAVNKFFRKAEPIKDTVTETITKDSQELSLPADFFVPLEVFFNSTDNLRYPSKELEYEEYLKWNPNIEETTTSFSEIITSATPQELVYTQENLDYDGLIGYVFSDTSPQKLLWKPAVNGTVIIYYAVTPSVDLSDLSASPELHSLFHTLISDEVTIMHLVRRLGNAKDEATIYSINLQLKHYKTERDETLADLSGYVNRNVETPQVIPHNFLNDPWMTIRNSN